MIKNNRLFPIVFICQLILSSVTNIALADEENTEIDVDQILFAIEQDYSTKKMG